MAYRQNAQGGAQNVPQADNSTRLMGMVNQLLPQIRKALPSIMTPERFTRITCTAIQNNPKLAQCSPVSFLNAMMNAAQLGLEPNTPLGQAYLIPYWNGKAKCYEAQIQIGYKGLLALSYRTRMFQTIQAHTVFENDRFEYAFGLEEKLVHIPAMSNRGNPIYFYALYKLDNGGYGFQVMSREDCDRHRDQYSKASQKGSSPWDTAYEAMCKKTVLKQLLKYAPVSSDIMQAMTVDQTVSYDNSILGDITVESADNPFQQIQGEEQGLIDMQPEQPQGIWEQPVQQVQPEPAPVQAQPQGGYQQGYRQQEYPGGYQEQQGFAPRQQGFPPQQGFAPVQPQEQQEMEQLDFFGA